MENLININEYPVRPVLKPLLADKTTKKNIIFATDAYESRGAEFSKTSEITKTKLLGFDAMDLQPRVLKSLAAQQQRTRKNAEVFTPSWVCNKMNNHCDAEWFGKENVFNTEEGHSWKVKDGRIVFPKDKTWQDYIDSRRIEITCGEAPYIVSRYDTSTGESIPITRRIGILDRKLRIVNENTGDEETWLKWAARAIQSVYGYEYQGDNLLIARINVLCTFTEYLERKWARKATEEELKKMRSKYTKVPDLTDQGSENIGGLLGAKSLEYELSPALPDGSNIEIIVTDQYPKPGTEVTKGTKVTIYYEAEPGEDEDSGEDVED